MNICLKNSNEFLRKNICACISARFEDIVFTNQQDAQMVIDLEDILKGKNVFGKWHDESSVVTKFCKDVIDGLAPSIVSDEILKLVYIDDVAEAVSEKIKGKSYEIPEYEISLTGLLNLIISFKESRNSLMAPDFSQELNEKIYATYLSYLPKDKFSYSLKQNVDVRGSFTEILKTEKNGQVSVNISKPGITKGEHWHMTKNEKFLVVSGKGVIRFRDIYSDEIIEYFVSGDKLEVVDIPTGYTHNIENLGNEDMVTIMWASELFDPEKPDTYFEKV